MKGGIVIQGKGRKIFLSLIIVNLYYYQSNSRIDKNFVINNINSNIINELQSYKHITSISKELGLSEEKEILWKEIEVCYASSIKTYMDYHSITDKNSVQYTLIYNNFFIQQDGLLLSNDESYIAVALGSVYGEIGSKYRITTDKGNEFYVVKVDGKSDIHTVNGCVDYNDSILEFIIDIELAATGAHYSSIQMGDFNYSDMFQGTIVKIEKQLD